MTNEQMEFPKTWEEYEQEYGFNDAEEVYSNNIRLIPSFRVKQWLEHINTQQESEGEKMALQYANSYNDGFMEGIKHNRPNCGARMEEAKDEE